MHGSRRRLLSAIAALAVLVVLWAPALPAASASSTVAPDAEQRFFDLLSGERAGQSLAAYAVAPDLIDVARGQAERMATEHRLYHNPNLGNEVRDWDACGENVGRGPSIEEIHQAFMDSPTHRSEILSTTFTQVGIGVHVTDQGEVWVAQVFRKPTPAPAAAPATPAATPAAAATAAPRPERAPRSSRTGATTPPVTAAAPAPPAPEPAPVDATAELVAALTAAFDAQPRPAASPVAAAPAVTAPAVASAPERDLDVTFPVRVAASLLVLVVAWQLVFVRRQVALAAAPAPSVARRQRSHASMKPSTSPSSTPVTLPVS